jgi:hypothetical protein
MDNSLTALTILLIIRYSNKCCLRKVEDGDAGWLRGERVVALWEMHQHPPWREPSTSQLSTRFTTTILKWIYIFDLGQAPDSFSYSWQIAMEVLLRRRRRRTAP